jgi:hypothetical protein
LGSEVDLAVATDHHDEQTRERLDRQLSSWWSWKGELETQVAGKGKT